MHTLTLAELARKLRAQRILQRRSSRSALLDRIEASQPQLNAFVTVTAERALAQARRADAALARGDGRAAHRLPIAHKDIFCTRRRPDHAAARACSTNFVVAVRRHRGRAARRAPAR